ncbi:hypothetical protein ACIPF8_06730 [Collimonas sp. NPDC087041]|uniref:hypothetical protein n=1 Tax=Collimonas sp. NPDC087041 TaxID=3363960 RepID=UPI00381A2947
MSASEFYAEMRFCVVPHSACIGQCATGGGDVAHSFSHAPRFAAVFVSHPEEATSWPAQKNHHQSPTSQLRMIIICYNSAALQKINSQARIKF